MLIGIDASRALRAQRTGTEHYSLEIIRHLLQLPESAEHQWRFYVDQPIPSDSPLRTVIQDRGKVASHPHSDTTSAPHPEVELCVLSAQRMWTHLQLGREVRRRPPAVLFVPAHVLPFGMPHQALPPSVVTVHDLGYRAYPEMHTRSQRLYLEWSTRWNIWAAECVIAISQNTANDLQRIYSLSPTKIRVIAEGVRELTCDVPTAPILEKFGLTSPYVLYLGTIQPRKNLARVLEAFAQLQQRVEWDLVLAGKPGWLSTSLYEKAQELGIKPRVRFLGYVSDTESTALLRNAHFFCLPSLFEGFGLPILEAQSVGVPVMTSNNSSIPEVAGDGALLVDPTDVDAIAQAMLQLSQDETLRQQLISAGYTNVKRFSWKKAAQETLAVLKEAAQLGRANRKRPTK
ncbi:MAG: glycosyltransferase family 1 protein [Caldilineaceae bacterium]